MTWWFDLFGGLATLLFFAPRLKRYAASSEGHPMTTRKQESWLISRVIDTGLRHTRTCTRFLR